jgi:DNA-binding transcriptional regulator PaaX
LFRGAESVIFERLKPRTEELLYFLLWSAKRLMWPSFRDLDESFEGWAYSNGFLRELALLEKQRLVERGAVNQRIYRLTAEGRLVALGGRDPQVQWSRPWDGRWRLICFDVPIAENRQRRRLRRYLRNKCFGYLQHSIWITPDILDEETRLLGSTKPNVESLILLEARPCAGESNADIVAGAWDFTATNRLYERHLKILKERPAGKIKSQTQAAALRRWAEEERISWRNAINVDPLLPKALLPRKYLGEQAWRRRIRVLELARRDLDSFKP